MKNLEPNTDVVCSQTRLVRPSPLHLVTAFEMEELRHALTRGEVPPDLEAKLNRLATGDLTQRSVARNCRCFVALLLAAHDHWFREATERDCERLLRVLAYVRKDDDAIPDYQPQGYSDDQEEVRTVAAELASLLQSFKAWRLRNQVPGMWTTIPRAARAA
jgi:hypothetical protein